MPIVSGIRKRTPDALEWSYTVVSRWELNLGSLGEQRVVVTTVPCLYCVSEGCIICPRASVEGIDLKKSRLHGVPEGLNRPTQIKHS